MANLTEYLSSGSTGADVKFVQTVLKAAGYNVGEIDGDYGPITLAAVKAYQRDSGLVDDGIVGNYTWDTLTRQSVIDKSAGVLEASKTKLADIYTKKTDDAGERLSTISGYVDNSLNSADVNLSRVESAYVPVIDKPAENIVKIITHIEDAADNILTSTDRNLSAIDRTTLGDIDGIVIDSTKVIDAQGNTISYVTNDQLDKVKTDFFDTNDTFNWGIGNLIDAIVDGFKESLAFWQNYIQECIDRAKILLDFVGELSDFIFVGLFDLLKGALDWSEEDLPAIVESVFTTLEKITATMAARRAEGG